MTGSQGKVLDLRSVFGLEATVTTPSADTDGAYVEMDMVLQPKGHTDPHYHPEQEETFDVLDGILEVLRDGDWQQVAPGESVSVPRGGVHAFRNATATPVRFLNVHRPALSFEGFLETLHRLIQAGKVKGPRGLRSGIYLSMSAVEQGTSVQLKPPQWLLRGLAFVGRRLGYRLD
jgi:quercetin dioxygenase-like cupin family protein